MSGTRIAQATTMLLLSATAWGCGGGPTAATSDAEGDAAAKRYAAQLNRYADAVDAAARKRGGDPLPQRVPRLAAVEDGGPAYERAEAAADRAAALDRELRLVLTASGSAEQAAYGTLYGIGTDFYEARDRALFAWTDERAAAPRSFVATRTGTTMSERYRRHMAGAVKTRAERTLAAARQADRRLTEVAGDRDDELVRSSVAFSRDTYAEQGALLEELIADVDDDPATAAVNHPGEIRSTGVDAYPIAVGAATEHRPALVRAFAGRLRAVAERPDRLPAVGDPYRAVITDLRAAREPKQSEGTLRTAVRERLWMLWRVRELEKTPDAAYRTARDTLLNFSVDEARTQSRAMAASLQAVQDLTLLSDRPMRRGLEFVLDWSARELQGPINPILADTRERYLAQLEQYPTGVRAHDRREAAFKRARRTVLAGVERLDDGAAMRRALRETVAATRQAA